MTGSIDNTPARKRRWSSGAAAMATAAAAMTAVVAAPGAAHAAASHGKTITFSAPFTAQTDGGTTGCDDATAACNAQQDARPDGTLSTATSVSRLVPVPESTWNPTFAYAFGSVVQSVTVPRNATTVTVSVSGTLTAAGCDASGAPAQIVEGFTGLDLFVQSQQGYPLGTDGLNPSLCDNRNVDGTPYQRLVTPGPLGLTTRSFDVSAYQGATINVTVRLGNNSEMYANWTRPSGSASATASYQVQTIEATFA